MRQNIGIVSVSAPAAALTFQYINEIAIARNQDPTITIHHLSFQEYISAINKEDWQKVADYILFSLNCLRRLGATFAIIPANTVHFVFEQVQKKSSLRIISMLDCVSKEICRQGFRSVAILGTRFTVKKNLYGQVLRKLHIHETPLPESLVEAIHNLIMDEIIPNKIQKPSLERISLELRRINCDCFVLACTELPLVFNEKNLLKPCIDTTRVLAEAAIEYSLEHCSITPFSPDFMKQGSPL